jgi:hypothetical protein
MILLYIVCVLIVLIGSWSLWQWWRDEQEKAGKSRRTNQGAPVRGVIPAISSPATPLHPTIDPYLSELRAYLLTPPLPQGPGEMAERVYAHLTQWVNTHLNEDANHTVDVSFEGELLVAPETESRFINMSTNEPVPTGYLEELMREE